MDKGFALISAVVAAFVSGFIAPYFIYRIKRDYDSKKEAFDLAIKALACYYTDALSPKVQNESESINGLKRKVNTRLETDELMDKALSYVRSYYSEEAFKEFAKATTTFISIENVPNEEFESQKTKAIKRINEELEADRNHTILTIILMIALFIAGLGTGYYMALN